MEENTLKLIEKVKELIALGKKKKSILELQEINDFFSDMELDSEQMDKVFEALEASNIDVLRIGEGDEDDDDIEIMLTEDGPKVIEMAARLGGDFITSKLVPLSTGIDFVEGTVATALGLPFDFTPRLHRGSAIRFITAGRAGSLRTIDVPESVHEAEGVEEVEIYLSPGDSIETPHSSNDRIGHVVCKGFDADEAARQAERALSEIQVVVA